MILFYIILIICILLLVKKYLNSRSKKEINFDEFDDVEKVLKQEKHEKEQLSTDLKILNRISLEANLRAAALDTPEAYEEARREIAQAKKDIKNFRFLDAVEFEENKIYEGPAIVELKENENDFDIELFKKWCKEIFKCIKSGSKEELEAIKFFITEEMYTRLMLQLERFEQDGLEFVTKNLIISDCKILDYSNWLEKEEIQICIKARMKEYILQKNTKKILRGSNRKSYEKEIIMTFLKHNTKDSQGFISNCPNCGSQLAQTELGKCAYCNTLVFPINYNWTLTKFETI